jgi:hypothetical protein
MKIILIIMSITGLLLSLALIFASIMFITHEGGGYLYLISGIFFLIYCILVMIQQFSKPKITSI